MDAPSPCSRRHLVDGVARRARLRRSRARANDRIIGPIVASLATIAMWEVARPLRWVNVILGAWLLIAPWVPVLAHPARWNSLATGALILICSLVKGTRSSPARRRLVVVVEGRPPDGRSRRS